MANERGLYNILVLSTTDIIPEKKLRYFLNPLTLCPALNILRQKAVMLNTSRIVRKFLAEQRLRSALSV